MNQLKHFEKKSSRRLILRVVAFEEDLTKHSRFLTVGNVTVKTDHIRLLFIPSCARASL